MNIYYAPPTQINRGWIELTGQEATHASKVMRAREGDRLTVVDGKGGRYAGPVRRIMKDVIQIEVEEKEENPASHPQLILGMGIIKKRDRLEFAVEKAVELGAAGICLFRSDHTIKENVRMDRLESIALSAMKQSLRTWLPEITLYHSFSELLNHFPNARRLMAHEKVSSEKRNPRLNLQEEEEVLLLVGPEGGFSPNEVEEATRNGASLYTLGKNRLRAETAAVAFLSQFLNLS